LDTQQAGPAPGTSSAVSIREARSAAVQRNGSNDQTKSAARDKGDVGGRRRQAFLGSSWMPAALANRRCFGVVLGIALVGGGALVGSLDDTATQFVNLRTASAGVDIAEATRTAQQTAGATALSLRLSMLTAAVGGSIGAKLWPGHGHRDAHNR
jgi:hypothetical protein